MSSISMHEIRFENSRLALLLASGLVERLDIGTLSGAMSHPEFARIREIHRRSCNALCVALLNAPTMSARIEIAVDAPLLVLELVCDRIECALFLVAESIAAGYGYVPSPGNMNAAQFVLTHFYSLDAGMIHVA